MIGYRKNDFNSLYCGSSSLPAIDAWTFHPDEPSYRRQVASVGTLELYALSSSTCKLTYIRGHVDTGPPEFRVHGPHNELVWYVLPIPEKPKNIYRLRDLAHILYMQGKFVEV